MNCTTRAMASLLGMTTAEVEASFKHLDRPPSVHEIMDYLWAHGYYAHLVDFVPEYRDVDGATRNVSFIPSNEERFFDIVKNTDGLLFGTGPKGENHVVHCQFGRMLTMPPVFEYEMYMAVGKKCSN